MAAGRGEFFRSLLAALEKRPAHPPPSGRWSGGALPRPGACGGEPAVNEQPAGDKRRKRRPKATRGSGRRTRRSFPEGRGALRRTGAPPVKEGLSEDNLVERLPSEVLTKILSYLDASSLFCISHVSRLFHHLANDDFMWEKIYMAEIGSRTWKPKLDDAAVQVGDRSAGHWKKMYLRAVAGQEMNKWRRQLRDISLYTGLPRQTEWVLRNLKVSWELTVFDDWGQKTTLKQSRAYFFESSVIVHWTAGNFNYRHISSIQLHAVRTKTQREPGDNRTDWRSLILKLDVRAQFGQFMGKDRLIKLRHLQPGFIFALWRGQGGVAFILVSLHLHKLVEKSLLGSPVCQYSEAMDRLPVDNSDPEFGLHGYTLHFVLHNPGTEIMSAHFCNLSCHTVPIQRGLVELRVIERANVFQHRSLSGHFKLPWKSEELEGSVENCCIMTFTLLDDFQRPFWYVTSPVALTPARKPFSLDYRGEHYVMVSHHPDGQVKMNLVWLKEQKHFFLIGLTLFISVFKVNKHFGREY